MSEPRPTDLRRGECLALLATVPIGRIVYTDHALPAAHPVSFFLDDEEAICWIGGQARVVTAVDHSIVAFQADEINTTAQVGWSVCGVGQASAIVDPARLAELAERAAQSWHLEEDPRLVSVPLRRLTGRRIGDGDAGWWAS